MNAKGFLAIMYEKIKAYYPKYEVRLYEKAVTVRIKDGMAIHVLEYENLIDKMVLRFIEVHDFDIGDFKGSSTSVTLYGESIDSYNIDYYNISNNQMDYIVENLCSGLIQKQFELYEDLKKDFEW